MILVDQLNNEKWLIQLVSIQQYNINIFIVQEEGNQVPIEKQRRAMQRISYRPGDTWVYQSRRMMSDRFHQGIRKEQRERMIWDMRKRLYEQLSTSGSQSQSFIQDRNSHENIHVSRQRRVNSQLLDNHATQNGTNKVVKQMQIVSESINECPRRQTEHVIIEQENRGQGGIKDVSDSLYRVQPKIVYSVESPTLNHNNSPRFSQQYQTQDVIIQSQLQDRNHLSYQRQVGFFVPVQQVPLMANQSSYKYEQAAQKMSQETLGLDQHVNPYEFSFNKQQYYNQINAISIYNQQQTYHQNNIQTFNVLQENRNIHSHSQQNYIQHNPILINSPPTLLVNKQVQNTVDYLKQMQFINQQMGFKFNSPDLSYSNFQINRSPKESQNIPMAISSPVYFDQQFYLLKNKPSPPVPHIAQMINNFMEIQEPQKVYQSPQIKQNVVIKPIQTKVRQIYKIRKPSQNIEKPLKPIQPIQKVEENSIKELFKRRKQQKGKIPQRRQERKASQVINLLQRDEQTRRENNQLSIIKRHLHYSIYSKVLGKGSYGSVYQGMNTITGQKVAVKKIVFRKINQLAEIDCLKQIKHENVMTLYDYYYEAGSKQLYLFLEYCGLNLRQKLESLQQGKKGLMELIHVKVSFIVQLIRGMNKLNQKGYIHRDLKFENILVKDDSIIKICDFGLCRKLNNKLQVDSVRCGTPYTMAPEIYFHPKQDKQNPIYTEKSDIFSLAVIIYEILYDIHPFDYMEDRLKKFDIYKRQETKEKFKSLLKLAEKDKMNIDWIEKIIEGGLKKVDSRISWEELMNIFKKGNDLQPKDQIKRDFLKKTNKFEQVPSLNKHFFEQEKPKPSKIIQLPNLNLLKYQNIKNENKQCNPEQYSGKKEQISNRMIKQNQMDEKIKDISELNSIKSSKSKSQAKSNCFKDLKELRRPYKNKETISEAIEHAVESKQEENIVMRGSVRSMVLGEQKAESQAINSRRFFRVLVLISIILLAINILFVGFSKPIQLLASQTSSIY